jgi:hypothetical protein
MSPMALRMVMVSAADSGQLQQIGRSPGFGRLSPFRLRPPGSGGGLIEHQQILAHSELSDNSVDLKYQGRLV